MEEVFVKMPKGLSSLFHEIFNEKNTSHQSSQILLLFITFNVLLGYDWHQYENPPMELKHSGASFESHYG